MKRRVFVGLGVTSIGAGVLHSTGAFSSLSAGRGIAVTAAGDSDGALLGIETTDSGDKRFTNNGSETMTIDLSSDDNIEFDTEESLTIEDLSAGDSEVVEISGTDDEAIVTIFVELKDGENIIGSIDLEREFNIPDAAALQEVEGTITAQGKSGKFEFNLRNAQPESGTSAFISEFRIDRAENTDDNVNADDVGGNNKDLFILEDNNERLVEDSIDKIDIGSDTSFTQIYRDDAGEDGSRGEGTVELEPDGEDEENTLGNEREFSFDRFRESDKFMGANEVDITFRAEDGSEAQVELRPL